jgi:beta-1,4-mannosyl-glycoprotein beta-1,4-N-acetylglucosaminyltransferase
MKIVDCFIFYNEIDLLIYRLNVLNDVVDHFIIVESTCTHTGKEKPLIFYENKKLFEKFNHKIIHVIVDDFPYKYPNVNIMKNEQWINENFQRNAIARGFQNLNLSDNDLITITDLDEIPDPNTLNKIKNNEIHVEINSLEMDLYYYNLHSRFINKWYHPKIINYKSYRELKLSCNDIRFARVLPISNGGWHLSYFGDNNHIKNKINNFTHQEYNNNTFTDLNHIDNCINNCKDLYNRDIPIEKIKIEDNKYLPVDYEKYLIKFI